MKHPLPPLDALKVFESAARHLSFTAAAAELCLTKGAVSYQVRRLEQQLGCALFRRAIRQVYLTEAGQTLHRTTRNVFEELGDTLKRIAGADRQEVVIATTTYVAARWLSARVARFLERHPSVEIRFHHDETESSAHPGEVDLSITWGACRGAGDPKCLREMPMPLFPVCSPDMAAAIQGGSLAVDSIRLLSENRQQDLWLEWFNQSALSNPRQVIQDANVRVQAAIDGQGLILADDMMQSELESGRLVTPFSHHLAGYGYRIHCPQPSPRNDRVESFINWLLQN